MRATALGAAGLVVAASITACTPNPPAGTVTVFTPAPTTASSAQPASKTATPTGPVLTQTYCTPHHRLCFRLPAGYSVSMREGDGSGRNVLGTVRDGTGQSVMTVAEGITGLGGVCPDEGKHPNTVIRTWPSGIDGLEVRAGDLSSSAIISEVVTRGAEGSGFSARAYLTQRATYEHVGTVMDCGIGFSDLFSRDSVKEGSFHLGVDGWSPDESAMPATFATAEQATAQFDTPRYRLAVAVMQSAYFG